MTRLSSAGLPAFRVRRVNRPRVRWVNRPRVRWVNRPRLRRGRPPPLFRRAERFPVFSCDSRDSGDWELSCCAPRDSRDTREGEPGAAATRSAPPDAGPRWPWERPAGSPGRGALARSAASSSSACGRETSLARIAALSVTFMPGMRSVSHSGPATTGRVLGADDICQKVCPERESRERRAPPVTGVTGDAGLPVTESHGRVGPRRGRAGPEGRGPGRPGARKAGGPEGRGPGRGAAGP